MSRVEEMTRFGAPETQATRPYCPFAADVFSLGYFFFDNFRVSNHHESVKVLDKPLDFQQVEEDLGPIVQIVRDMLASDSKHRVSALNALKKFGVLKSGLTPVILQRRFNLESYAMMMVKKWSLS